MKKKIINGIMMVALVAATSTSFVSCKDTNEDVKIELQQDYANLLTKLATLEKQYGDLGSKVSTLEAKVKNHSEDIATLQKEVDALEDWMIETFNNLVMGASIDATYANMTGSINIPGVEPFMLISNYGTAAEEGVFPSVKDKNGNQISWSANEELGSGKDAKIAISEDGNVNVTFNGGFAGYIYASVNRFFNDQKLQDASIDEKSVFSFSLVDSRGDEIPNLMIANVEKDGSATNDLLTWGWTRSENNMFKFGVAYAGEKAKDFEPAKIDLSKFKDDLKALWANRNRATGTSKESLGHLAADLYYNLATKNTNLPKYRLKIAWEDNFAKADIEQEYKIVAETETSADIIQEDAEKTEKSEKILGTKHYVTADGDILFAMYKPLSFNGGGALAEKEENVIKKINWTIEKAEVIENKIFDKIKAQIPNFNPVNGFTFDKVTAANARTANKLYYDTALNKYYMALSNINAGINWNTSFTVTGTNVDANALDLTAVIEPMGATIDQINDMMGQLNQLKNKLNGSTVTAWVKKFTGKFDTLFKNNAQQILEPVLLAIDKDGNVNRVSGSKAAPLVVEGEVTLDPTSYSAEIFAPAYAKYVGCKDITANGFNEILFANDVNLKFTPEKGKLYEIVYEAVDFAGITRSHTYYIQGKK